MSELHGIIGSILFVTGLLVGYLAGFFVGRSRRIAHNRKTLTIAKFLQLVVVLAGVLVFIVNNVADVFVEGYDVSPLLQIINGAIIGAAMNVNLLDALRSFFQSPVPQRPKNRRASR